MWQKLRKNMQEKEIAARPPYIKLYESASKNHVAPFEKNLEGLTVNEQEARESVWRPDQEVSEFRPVIKSIFQNKEVDRDEFIEALLTVVDAKDRQEEFYRDTVAQKFTTRVKSKFEQLQDGDIKPSLEPESRR
jgi:hypothetical protein